MVYYCFNHIIHLFIYSDASMDVDSSQKNHATWLKFWLLHMFVIWPKSKKSLADWDKMNECPNSDGGISNLRRKGGGFTTKNDPKLEKITGLVKRMVTRQHKERYIYIWQQWEHGYPMGKSSSWEKWKPKLPYPIGKCSSSRLTIATARHLSQSTTFHQRLQRYCPYYPYLGKF